MGDEPIKIGDQKDVCLAPSIRAWIKDDLAKMDYPDDMSGVKESLTNNKDSNSGCLSAITVLLLLSASITAIAATII